MKKKFHSFLNLKIICLFYDALSFISLGEMKVFTPAIKNTSLTAIKENIRCSQSRSFLDLCQSSVLSY